MMKFTGVFLILTCIAAFALGQTGKKTTPAAAKRPAAVPVATGAKNPVSTRTYTNHSMGFGVTFPDGWLISDDKFDAEMKKTGFDLSLRAPENVGAVDRIRFERSLKNVSVLVTAYRATGTAANGAIVRVSREDLGSNPQIRDAIDYFDAMRNQFKAMKLSPDLNYSETQAEKLGKWQFAFLDISSNAGRKRLYATVRRGYAILFSLSYTTDEDLQTVRQILSNGNFALK